MPRRQNNFEQTVVIPLRVKDGNMQFLYGGPMPALADGIAELRLPAYMVRDHKLLEVLRAEQVVKLLEKDAIFLIAMHRKWVTPMQASALKKPDQITPQNHDYLYLPARLLEPACLRLRGTKDADLLPVKCKVEGVSQVATSINHAYTLASKFFEHGRKSNAGNVFDLCLFQGGDEVWRPLRTLRNYYEAEFEKRFSQI